VVWEYRKIVLNEHHRKGDDIDLLCELGADRWELVTITPNNIAYLKRREAEDPRPAQSETGKAEETVSRVEPKYRDPATGETWSGRGLMASWLKRKQDAGEDIDDYLV
jgi:DNA-binding protein H-NS